MKYWDASLDNAKIYFTYVHGVEAVRTFISTSSAGGFPILSTLSFHLASASQLALFPGSCSLLIYSPTHQLLQNSAIFFQTSELSLQA